MEPSARQKIISHVTDYYLGSRDFNGPLAMVVMAEFDLEWHDLQEGLTELLKDDKICLMFESVVQNPHIKRFPELPTDQQLIRLESEEPQTICVYPSNSVLNSVVAKSDYEGRPFSLRLALGEPQVQPEFFDLSILEWYSLDPRYVFNFGDYEGSVSISDKFDEASGTDERDKIVLQSFGLGYDDQRNRVVTVFLRYMANLTPEHQQMWNARLVTKPCKMAEAYWKNSILGEFVENGSIFEAILEEQRIINEMCQYMGRPSLFRSTFAALDRPKEFTLFLRPTKRNLLEFIHTLDKMLSENIDVAFFRNEIATEQETPLSNGKIEVHRVGSLMLLKSWLQSREWLDDPAVIDEIVEPLRRVRDRRQKPAHSLIKDDYDPNYFEEQIEILKDVYSSLKNLRLTLALHPSAGTCEIPDWLEKGDIALY